MDTEKIMSFLSGKGVRPTANRILVVRELLASSRPVSIADIEQSTASMDRSSIFRVLELLAEKEIVHVIEDGTRALKYEICHSHDHHATDDRHVHFYCERCRETFCLEDVRVPRIEVPEGYVPRAVNYLLKGLCPKCAVRR